jgi:hypothetical protein
MNEKQLIQNEAAKIAASGLLGRSRSYRRLFEYLVENSLEGRQPKEIEIATEVFSKGAEFDPTQDSMVRVYAHNLRQKLKQYYDDPENESDVRLCIPRGEYRLAIETATDTSADEPAARSSGMGIFGRLAAPAAALVIGVVIGLAMQTSAPSNEAGVASSPLWSQITDDDLPVLVVVGDYYIFAELDDDGNVARFVREFEINSPQDLDDFVARHSEFANRYQDLDVTYLARSAGPVMRDVLSVLYAANKSVDVVAMSEFDPADLVTNHVVYVGYLSALDKLFDFVFASSQLAIGDTFDQLWNIETGEMFQSEAGRPNDYRNYRDYGFFSTFPGPSGNQFVIIAGTRDEGVMQVGQLVSNPLYLPTALEAVPDGAMDGVPAYELLYEVTGFDRTSIDAMLVHSAPLNYDKIWRGELLQAVGQ